MRMSARFFGQKIGKTASQVYEKWHELGIVKPSKFGDWDITDLGHKLGGRMSRSNYRPVPTFDFETIKKLMDT